MSIKEAIKQRRSIRKYLDRKVPEALVLEVLEAAGWAPSAHNAQPWRFIVVSNVSVKRRLAEAMAASWATDASNDGTTVEPSRLDFSIKRFSNAPVVIVACLSMEGMREYPDEKRRQSERDLAVQSLGAAIQNMLLSAYANGLGACWFSSPAFCKDAVRDVLGVPEAVEPQAIVLMGYPDEKAPIARRKLLGYYCFVEGWGKPLC
jgi:coenzyme F420-0:L-glutamate ligase/coenzyme F420-1:gamma-L-glutamate ligase